MAHLRPIDKEFEDADDTGVLVLSSRNLRNFPVVPGDLCDFTDLLEAGRTPQGAVNHSVDDCPFSTNETGIQRVYMYYTMLHAYLW